MQAWDKEKCVAFKYTKEKYGEFSNFYQAPLKIFDWHFPTSEHLYQALKFSDVEIQKKISSAPSPYEAKKIAHAAPSEKVIRTTIASRTSLMSRVLRIKFRQHPKLLKLLLSTDPFDIVEDSERDQIWGATLRNDGFYYGNNYLGLLLTELRDNVKNNANYINKPWVLKRSVLMGHVFQYRGPEYSTW